MGTITGTDNSETLNGTSGDDTIFGLGGNDTLNGGAGHDILIGGAGADILNGGPDADIYQDSSANFNGDEITTIKVGDRIQITDLNLGNHDTVGLTGNQLVYTHAGVGGSITIDNLGPGRLVYRAMGSGSEFRLQQDAHNDFNGDGRSDILWRSGDGTVTDWLAQANGGYSDNSSNFLAQVSNGWQIVGTGDFNGDGRVDLLWRNSDGTVTDWLSQANGGFTGNSANLLTQVDNSWHIAGTGDFNGDGFTDILWQNGSTLTDWIAKPNGGFFGNSGAFLSQLPTGATIAGTGDFNGDGIDDLLLRKTDGTVTDWLGQSNGSFVDNSANFQSQVDNSWHIAGTGDFNSDGVTDILWRSDSGAVTDWLGSSSGSFYGNSGNFLAQVATSAHLVSIGDFNGDTFDDLLWRGSDGTLTQWLGQPNGSLVLNPTYQAQVDTSWHVADPALHSFF